MELSALKIKIIESFTGSEQDLEAMLRIVEQDKSVFPFNEYEYLLANLIENGGLSYQQYIDIRTEYIYENPNLWIFEIAAPRVFGEQFAQNYVKAKCSKLEHPSKKSDPNYAGDYDLWLDGIRIEVKASRAVDSESDAPLYMKALSRNTNKNFVMNFQQLKPQCCDVFIWLAVFRDQIVLWVISSKEVAENRFYSRGQHRGNSGNEGQLHLKKDNLNAFDAYILEGDNLEEAIRNAAQRN